MNDDHNKCNHLLGTIEQLGLSTVDFRLYALSYDWAKKRGFEWCERNEYCPNCGENLDAYLMLRDLLQE